MQSISIWLTDRRVSREAAAINLRDIQKIAFCFPPVTDDDGLPMEHDIPHLVFKHPKQFQTVLQALRSAKVRGRVTAWGKIEPEPLTRDRVYAVVIELKRGGWKYFSFGAPKYPEKSFGPPFRAVLRMLGDESAKQVHQEIVRIRNRIKAVRGASGREWQNPSEVQAIVSELLKVNRSFFEYEKHELDAPRIVKVLHDKGQLSIGFLVYDDRLIKRYKWL